MASIVLELQQEALNSSVPVSDLLRKSLVVAKKLGIQEFYEWVELELNGYSDLSKVPNYRIITGKVEAWNPYHGWIPAVIDNVEIAEAISKRSIIQPIGEIDNLANDYNGGSTFEVPFDKKTELMLMNAGNIRLQPTLKVDKSQLMGILDAVRNIILNWSLKLDSDGILGEGMTFSKEEKNTATKLEKTYTINNFIGQMTNSQIQQNTTDSRQSLLIKELNIDEVEGLIRSLKESIDKLNLQEESKSEIIADIKSIESQLSSPKPKKGIIKEGLRSLRTILEGAVSSTLSSGIIHQISSLLGTG